MDKITKDARSQNMAKIRSKNTKPELLLRRALFANGLRYRLHYRISGKPDIVFPGKKVAIFVNGCFWHGHSCPEGHTPKTNKKFWVNKIEVNQARDKRNVAQLRKAGWKVLTLWECGIEKNLDKEVLKVTRTLRK